MQSSHTSRQCGEPLTLPEILDLRAAAPLATSLMAAQGSSLILDGSKVKKVGAQFMQLIVSAHLTWDRDGLHLTLTNPSQELTEAFKAAGVGIDGFTEKGAA